MRGPQRALGFLGCAGVQRRALRQAPHCMLTPAACLTSCLCIHLPARARVGAAHAPVRRRQAGRQAGRQAARACMARTWRLLLPLATHLVGDEPLLHLLLAQLCLLGAAGVHPAPVHGIHLVVMVAGRGARPMHHSRRCACEVGNWQALCGTAYLGSRRMAQHTHAHVQPRSCPAPRLLQQSAPQGASASTAQSTITNHQSPISPARGLGEHSAIAPASPHLAWPIYAACRRLPAAALLGPFQTPTPPLTCGRPPPPQSDRSPLPPPAGAPFEASPAPCW